MPGRTESFFERLPGDRSAAREHNLKTLRLVQHRTLLEESLVERLFKIIRPAQPRKDDDFFVIRQSTVCDLDASGQISPELEDVLDVYAGLIRPDSCVIKIHQLKPLNDLAEFNTNEGQLQVAVKTTDEQVSLLPIRGLPLQSALFLDGLLSDLSSEHKSHNIDVDPDTLTKPEPTSFIKDGIPLI